MMKNRSFAIILSVLPGCGILYLERYRHLLWFIPGYLILISIVIKLLTSSETIATNLIFYLMSIFILIIAIMMPVSIIETEYQGNLLKLPYEDNGCNFCIKDYKKAYNLWTVIPSGLGIVSTILYLVKDGVSLFPCIVLIGWVAIICVSPLLIKNFRNVKYSDMASCPGRKK